MTTPFARLITLTTAIAAAMQRGDKADAQRLGMTYRSRGHGGKFKVWQRSCLGRAMRDRSKYNPR